MDARKAPPGSRWAAYGFFALFILTGVLLIGPSMGILMRSGFAAHPPIRAWPIFKAGIAISIPFYAGILLSRRFRSRVKAFVRRKGKFWPDYGRGILGFFIIFILVFLPLILANGLAFLNGVLDRAPELRHETVISAKAQSGGGRSAVSYILEYPSWRSDGLGDRLDVPKEFYESVEIGSPLEVVTKPGRFGFEWVVSYRRIAR